MAQPTTDAAENRCPYCQAKSDSAAAFCLFCGRPLPVRNARPDVPESTAPLASPAQNEIPIPSASSATRRNAGVERTTLGAAPPRATPPSSTAPNAADAGATAPPYVNLPEFSAGDYPPSWYPPAPPARNRLQWGTLLVAVFIIGIGGGVWLTNWLTNSPGNSDRTPAALARLDPDSSAAEHTKPSAAEAPGAISLGELPYDNATASVPGTTSDRTTADAAASTQRGPTSQAPGAISATGADDPVPAAENSGAATANMPDSTSKENGAPSSAPAAGSVVTPRNLRPKALHRSRAGHQKTARANPEDEADPTQRGDSDLGERSLTPLMLTQCASMSSILEREQCKQEVCNGKGGQYGCAEERADNHGQ